MIRKLNKRHFNESSNNVFSSFDKVDKTRLGYVKDVLEASLEENRHSNAGKKAIKDFIDMLDNGIPDGYKLEIDNNAKNNSIYGRSLCFSVYPDSYETLDDLLEETNIYFSFVFDYGKDIGDEFYMSISTSKENYIDLVGKTKGISLETNKFTVDFDDTEDKWSSDTLLPEIKNKFKAYERRSKKAYRKPRFHESCRSLHEEVSERSIIGDLYVNDDIDVRGTTYHLKGEISIKGICWYDYAYDSIREYRFYQDGIDYNLKDCTISKDGEEISIEEYRKFSKDLDVEHALCYLIDDYGLDNVQYIN